MKVDGSLFFFVCLFSISLSEAIVCNGSAKYKLTFKGEWTNESHPQDFPADGNPHFSSVVGCSHNSRYVMWKTEKLATLGVKDVAELGSLDNINKEIENQISLKKALARFQGDGILNNGTVVVKDIQVNTDSPLVSAISMIIPSPDWFVGVSGFNLCNETDGNWFEKRVRNLPLYDSGTDSAPSFVHVGTPTDPHIPIFLITHIPEGSSSNETLKRFGRFTFEKTFDSTTMQPPTTKPSSANTVAHLGVVLKFMILTFFFVNIF